MYPGQRRNNMSELFKKAYNTATQMYNSGSSPIVRRATGGISKLIETEAGLQEMYPAPDGNYYTIDGFDERGLYDPKYDKTSDEFARKTLTDQYLLEKQQEAVKQAGGPQRGYSSQFGKSISVAKPGEASEKPVTLVNKFLATPSPINVTSQTADTTADQVDRAATERSNLAQAKAAADYFNRFMPPSAPKTTTYLDRIDYDPGFAGAGTVTTPDGSFATIDDAAVDTVAAFKGGGGLSNINKTMMINGQPHKLAYINPDEASLLKSMGGSGRKVDGIPAYDTNEDSWSDYGGFDIGGGIAGGFSEYDDPGSPDFGMSPGAMGGYTGVDGSPQENFGQADMLAGPSNVPVVYTEEPTQPTEGPAPEGPATGGLDPTDAGLYRTQFKEGTLEIPLGTLDSRTYNTYLNDLIERTGDINEAEKLLNAALSIPGAAEDMQRSFDAGIGASLRGEGYRYGGPAGTLLDILEQGVNYDFADPIKKRLEKEEQRKDMEKETGILVDEKTKSTFGSVLDKVKDVFMGSKKLDKETIEGIQKDVAEKGGTFTPISRGLTAILTPTVFKIAGALLGGRPIGTLETPSGTFVVGEDGSLVNSAIASSPNLGNEPTAKRTGTQTKTIATSQDESEDAPKTGIAGLLEKRPDTVSLAQASEPSIQNLISLGIDPQAAREMLGVA